MCEVVKCSFPGCECRGLADRFFVPSRDAVREANEGIMPKAAELASFAVCDRHAGVIRKDGVWCWPLLVARRAVEDDEARQTTVSRWQEAQRKAKAAAAFQPKGLVKAGVGQGLGRFRKGAQAQAAHAIH